MTAPHITYEGAPNSLIDQWQKRRAPMGFAGQEGLPDAGVDLASYLESRVPKDLPPLPPDASRHQQKTRELELVLTGQSGLVLLHAQLTAHLRKRSFPDHAPQLFHRIWSEHSDHLLANLSNRWLISALITFGDHGLREDQRLLGRETGMLFSVMKLYEFERLFSGLASDQAFAFGKRAKSPLPLDMPPFSLGSGGLDINLLAPLWQRASSVPLAGPIAIALLEHLNQDKRSLFARLQTMRQRQAARKKSAANARNDESE
jgi:hypothetical protein